MEASSIKVTTLRVGIGRSGKGQKTTGPTLTKDRWKIERSQIGRSRNYVLN